MEIGIPPVTQHLICAWQNFVHRLLAHNHYGLSLTNPTFLQLTRFLLPVLAGKQSYHSSQCYSWSVRACLWTIWNGSSWLVTKTLTGSSDNVRQTHDGSERLSYMQGVSTFDFMEFQAPICHWTQFSYHVKLVKKAVLCACCKVLLCFLHCVIVFADYILWTPHVLHALYSYREPKPGRNRDPAAADPWFCAAHHNGVSVVGP